MADRSRTSPYAAPNRGREQFAGDAECFEVMPSDFWALSEKWQRLWKAANHMRD